MAFQNKRGVAPDSDYPDDTTTKQQARINPFGISQGGSEAV